MQVISVKNQAVSDDLTGPLVWSYLLGQGNLFCGLLNMSSW
jgi:hypothetical protein